MPDVRIVPDSLKLKDIVTNAGQSILLRFAHEIVRIARESTIQRSGPSAPGTPPHEHFGDLDRSLDVAIDADGNVIAGPRASIVGQRGSVLEFAGTFDPDAGRDQFGRFLKGHASRTAPSGARWARPFMRPAFEQAVSSGSFESGTQISSSFT
jgi:hypothetical protein